MFEHKRKAYVLLGVEPELDCLNPQLALSALKQASLVVYMSSFKYQPAFEYADVMLPVSPFTETAGTFVNTEGRVQSFNGVVKPMGDSRPAWKLLRVLGNVLNIEGFDYQTSEAVRDEVLGAGVEFVSGLDNGISGVDIIIPEKPTGLQRIADVPINFADSMARRSIVLQQTADAVQPVVGLNTVNAEQLGLATGSKVKVKQGDGEVILDLMIDSRIPVGCVRVSAAHASTSMLGEMFGQISVERA